MPDTSGKSTAGKVANPLSFRLVLEKADKREIDLWLKRLVACGIEIHTTGERTIDGRGTFKQIGRALEVEVLLKDGQPTLSSETAVSFGANIRPPIVYFPRRPTMF